jgi:adenylate kinase family enzyme
VERIAVVGCIGAGKSTLARTIGARLELPVIHLDRLWWTDASYTITGPKTAERWALPRDAYWALQERLAAQDRWIIDGGVDGLAIRLERADTVIVLETPLWLCALRVIKRTGRARDDYPPHVKESWRWAARLVWWVLWTYPRRRRRSIEATVAARSEQLTVIRLRSTSEIEAFAASLGS